MLIKGKKCLLWGVRKPYVSNKREEREMNAVPLIPEFLRAYAAAVPSSNSQRVRRKRVKFDLPKLPKSWRGAEKVRVQVYSNWPPSFPGGFRTVWVLRGKTNRGKFVRVREWGSHQCRTWKVRRDVFERSII